MRLLSFIQHYHYFLNTFNEKRIRVKILRHNSMLLYERCNQPNRMISSRLEHRQAAITRGSGGSSAEACTRQCAAAEPRESTHHSERRLCVYQLERWCRAPLFNWNRMSAYNLTSFTCLTPWYFFWNAYSYSPQQKTPCLYRIQKFASVFTKASRCNTSSTSSVHSTSS